MLQKKDWLLIVGLVVAFLGFECLPHGQSLLPKSSLSLFNQSSARGAFLSFGFITLLFGLVIVGISLFLRRK